MKGKPCKVKLSCAWEEYDGRRKKSFECSISSPRVFHSWIRKESKVLPKHRNPSTYNIRPPLLHPAEALWPVLALQRWKNTDWFLLSFEITCRAFGCPLQDCFSRGRPWGCYHWRHFLLPVSYLLALKNNKRSIFFQCYQNFWITRHHIWAQLGLFKRIKIYHLDEKSMNVKIPQNTLLISS